MTHQPTQSGALRPCVFFDDGRGVISPLVDLRAAFDVRTGALTTFERLRCALGLDPVALFAPAEVAPLVRESHSIAVNSFPASATQNHASLLLVNGRCVLPLDVLADIEPGQAAVEQASGDLICASVCPDDAARLLAGQTPDLDLVTVHDRVLLARPWDVITFRDRALAVDLGILLTGPSIDASSVAWIVGDHPVRVDPSARVLPGVVFDSSKGPIVIDRHAELRPGVVIVGPAYIGPASMVAEHGVIRPHTCIGPVCKVGGELAGAIVQGYSNKSHEGFLGDSWVGEWVNLGAGTITSNLLNTYSEISAAADCGLSRERTGLQFFGCVLADHVKTAIATRIMGGAVVHTGVMWASTSAMAGCVPRFAWVTDSGMRVYRKSRFLDTAEAMMRRRDMQPSEAYRRRLEQLLERA